MKPDKIKVAPIKIATVKMLVELIKNNETIMIASIKNLPSKQFQEIRKKLREKAEVIVVKKRIMLRGIEKSENKNLEKLKQHVQEDSAVLFSKEDAFELAGFLSENKNPIGARIGQEAIEDIEVEAGPTDILPGPAISEFGSLGIKIAVEDGKIAIKENKIIVKAGEKVKEAAASIMSKLEIQPFKVGLEPIAICEIKTGKIYLDVKIDKEKTIEDLQTLAAKSLGLAQKIAYYCKETIGYLLGKANADGKALEALQPAEEKKEEIKEDAEPKEPEDNKETENVDDKTQTNKSREEN